MAQELYLLRNGVNILTEPDTPITDFTVSIAHMGDNRLTAKFHYPKRLSFDLTEYVIYEKEGEYTEIWKGEWVENVTYHANDVVLRKGNLYLSKNTNANEPPELKLNWGLYMDIGLGNAPIEVYYLYQPPTWIKDEKSLMIEYSCEFTSKIEILKYIPMIDSWEASGDGLAPKKPFLYQTEYSFFGGVNEYFNNIKSSLVAEFGMQMVNGVIQPKGWRMNLDLSSGYPQQGDDTEITVSSTTVFAALQDIHAKFKVPFAVQNNTITVGGAKKYVAYRFRYGKGKGLYKLTKTNLNDSIITKVKGVGSERNIPFNYLQAEKKSAGLSESPMARLMPRIYRQTLAQQALDPHGNHVKDYYVSNNHNEHFPRISFETFDDIFPTIKNATYQIHGGALPHRIDKITGVYFESPSVAQENETINKDGKEEIVNPRFWVRIPALGFDLKTCLNEKDKLVLTPTSGQAGGCKFNVLSIGSKPNRWEGFRVNTLYEHDKFIVQPISQGLFTQVADLQFIYESNIVELPPLASFSYGFLGSYTIHASVAGVAGINIAIQLHRNGLYHATLHTQAYESSGQEIVSESISASGVYNIPANVDIANYKIHIVISTYSEANDNSVTLDMSRSEHLITYPIPAELFNDTTNTPQWLLVQKDIESYNTLMPYPVLPMWTSYTSPDAWEVGQWNPTHLNPVGLVPMIGDEYVFLGITLPQIYVTEAEKRLEDALLLLLENNKEYKANYECGFDEHMLIANPSINSDIQIGAIVKVYESTDPSEYVEPQDYVEVVINTLTLKYSADRALQTQNN